MSGEQLEMFEVTAVYDPAYENPMVVALGKGPQLTRCKGCKFFLVMPHQDKTYRKCKIRGISHSSSTDHKANYLACAKYEKAVEE